MSYDRLSLHDLTSNGENKISNAPAACSKALTLGIASIGTSDYSVKARVGFSGASASFWTSTTSISLQQSFASTGRQSLAVIASVAVIHGTITEAFSYDRQMMFSELTVGNGPVLMRRHVKLSGIGFGISQSSAMIRLGGTACTESLWISDEELSCRIPQGAGSGLAFTTTVQNQVSTLSSIFTYDAGGAQKLKLLTEVNHVQGLGIGLQPALQIQILDRFAKDAFFRGVGVYAQLESVDKFSASEQFGKWSFDSDARGKAIFTNLIVASKGNYRIIFWMDIYNSSVVTTPTSTVLELCNTALLSYSPTRSTVQGGSIISIFLQRFSSHQDILVLFGDVNISVPAMAIEKEYDSDGIPVLSTIKIVVPPLLVVKRKDFTVDVSMIHDGQGLPGATNCFVFQYEDPNLVIVGAISPQSASIRGKNMIEMLLKSIPSSLGQLSNLRLQVFDLHGREGGFAMAESIEFRTTVKSVATVMFYAPEFVLSMHVKICLQMQYQPDGVYKYRLSSDGWSIIGEVPFEYLKLDSAISPAISPLEGGVRSRISLHSLPVQFPSNFTLIFGMLKDTCVIEPEACIDIQSSMILEKVVTEWYEYMEISAIVEITTRATTKIGMKPLRLKWTTLSVGGTQMVNERSENVFIEYIHLPSLFSQSDTMVSIEGKVVTAVLLNPTPISSIDDLNILMTMNENILISPSTLALRSFSNFKMVLDIGFPVSWTFGNVRVLINTKLQLLPEGIDSEKFKTEFFVQYYRPTPEIVRIDPASVTLGASTEIVLYVRYLAPVSAVSEVLILIDGIQASPSEVKLIFSDPVYSTFSVISPPLRSGGIKDISITSLNGVALPGIGTVLVVDTSMSMLCTDGCASKMMEGHPVVFGINIIIPSIDSIGISGLNLFIGGLQEEVIDLASTGERYHEITIWCPPVNAFLSNATQLGKMKLSSAELQLKIELEVLGPPVMKAFSEISILLPPEMISSSFDPSGCSFSISFNMPTDKAGMGSSKMECREVIVVKSGSRAVQRSLGEPCSCYWQSAALLIVTPGQGTDIIPLDKVYLIATFASRLFDAEQLVLSHAFSKSMTSGIEIDPSLDSILPTLTLVGPQHLGGCGVATIQAVATSCRPLLYSWSCASDENVQALLSNASGWGVSFSSIRLPSSVLKLDQMYMIVASAIDFRGLRSKTVSHRLLKFAAIDIPTISVIANEPYFRTRPNLFRGQADFSPCLSEQPQIYFKWLVCLGSVYTDDSVFWRDEGVELLIPAYVLNASESYVARLLARPEGGTIASLDFQFATSSSELQPIILGGSRTISVGDELTLDASMSYDPDRCPPGVVCTDTQLIYEWKCQQEMISCRYVSDSTTFSDGRPILKLTGDSLGLYGVVTFQLKFSRGSRSASIETNITFVSTPTLAVSILVDTLVNRISKLGGMVINSDERVVLRGSVKESESVAWTWDALSICTSKSSVRRDCFEDQNSPMLIIPPELLLSGSKYAIGLDITSGVSIGHAEILLVVNEPPVLGGACTVNPLSGQALLQEFTVSCFGWADADLPLTYEYSAASVTSDERSIALPLSQQISARMLLSAGEQTIKVRAFDAYGAASKPWVSSKLQVSEFLIASRAENGTTSDGEMHAASILDDLATSFLKLDDVGGYLLFSTSVANSLDADTAQDSRRRKLLASSATYRMRVRKSLLKKMSGASKSGGSKTNSLVAQSVTSLSRRPDELTPDSTESVRDTLAAVNLTVRQAASNDLDDFVRTTSFIMSDANPSPKSLRESVGLTASKLLYRFGQTAVLSRMVQDPPRRVPDLESWVLYVSKTTCPRTQRVDFQTPKEANLSAHLSGQTGDEVGVILSELPSSSLWHMDTLPPRTTALAHLVGYGFPIFLPANGMNLGGIEDDVSLRRERGQSMLSNITVWLPLNFEAISHQDLDSVKYHSIYCVFWDPTSEIQTSWNTRVCSRVDQNHPPAHFIGNNSNVTFVACTCTEEGYVTVVFTYKPLTTSIDAPWVQVVQPVSVSSQAIDFLVVWQVLFVLSIILICFLNSCLQFSRDVLSSEAGDMQHPPLLQRRPEIHPSIMKSMKDRMFGQLQREITQRISMHRRKSVRSGRLAPQDSTQAHEDMEGIGRCT